MESVPSNGGEDKEDEIKRQELFMAIASGIDYNDLSFIKAITSNQEVLRPIEIAEYMNLMRLSIVDPVEQKLWEDMLDNYILSLDGEEFPQEETKAIKAISEIRRKELENSQSKNS